MSCKTRFVGGPLDGLTAEWSHFPPDVLFTAEGPMLPLCERSMQKYIAPTKVSIDGEVVAVGHVLRSYRPQHRYNLDWIEELPTGDYVSAYHHDAEEAD